MYRAQTSQAGHALLIIKIRQGASLRDVTFSRKIVPYRVGRYLDVNLIWPKSLLSVFRL